MSAKVQAVLAANPNTSWNDLVYNRLVAAVGDRNGNLMDLWMRWLALQGFGVGSFNERMRAWAAFRGVAPEDTNVFMLGWAAFFRESVPDAPSTPVATADVASATISFTGPAFTGNMPILGYRATVNPGGTTVESAGPPIVFPGLIPAVPVTFTVAARNGRGYGPESASSNSVTPT